MLEHSEKLLHGLAPTTTVSLEKLSVIRQGFEGRNETLDCHNLFFPGRVRRRSCGVGKLQADFNCIRRPAPLGFGARP
jgi:hypothetical protein